MDIIAIWLQAVAMGWEWDRDPANPGWMWSWFHWDGPRNCWVQNIYRKFVKQGQWYIVIEPDEIGYDPAFITWRRSPGFEPWEDPPGLAAWRKWSTMA